MPRKPNYRFERQERDRIKAAKKAERSQARMSRGAGDADDQPPPAEDETDASAPADDGADANKGM